MTSYILSFDLGTTSTKAVIVCRKGGIRGSATYAYDTYYPRASWAEQNPLDWWKAVCVVTKEVLSQSNISSDAIACVVFSGKMLGLIPVDESGNGGGYVFDCRAIHNPGRYDQYKHLTGNDQAVVEFFEQETDIEDYLKHVYELVDRSIEHYQQRNFRNFMVSFGCTGGQHRSVYCAERLADHLEAKYDVNVVLRHIEQEMK